MKQSQQGPPSLLGPLSFGEVTVHTNLFAFTSLYISDMLTGYHVSPFAWPSWCIYVPTPLAHHLSLSSEPPLSCLFAVTHQSPPPLPGFRLSCHWVLRGVMVVVSVSDVSRAWTGALLQHCRGFHRVTASDAAPWGRLVFYRTGQLGV